MDKMEEREMKRAKVLAHMENCFVALPTALLSDVKNGIISTSAFSLYAYLRFREGKNLHFFGSVEDMAWGTGMKTAQISRLLAQLVKAGHIKRTKRRGTTLTKCLTIVQGKSIFLRGHNTAYPIEERPAGRHGPVEVKDESIQDRREGRHAPVEKRETDEERIQWRNCTPYSTSCLLNADGAEYSVEKWSDHPFTSYNIRCLTDSSTSRVSLPDPLPEGAKELDILRQEIRKARDLGEEQMRIKATENELTQMAHASAVTKEPFSRVSLLKGDLLFGDEESGADEEAREGNSEDHQREKAEGEAPARDAEYEEVLLDDGEELFR